LSDVEAFVHFIERFGNLPLVSRASLILWCEYLGQNTRPSIDEEHLPIRGVSSFTHHWTGYMSDNFDLPAPVDPQQSPTYKRREDHTPVRRLWGLWPGALWDASQNEDQEAQEQRAF
jgi:hypothetical protein